MTPLEFVEFVASGDAAKFVLEHGFAALMLWAESVLKLYEEVEKQSFVDAVLVRYEDPYGV